LFIKVLLQAEHEAHYGAITLEPSLQDDSKPLGLIGAFRGATRAVKEERRPLGRVVLD